MSRKHNLMLNRPPSEKILIKKYNEKISLKKEKQK